MKHKMGNIISRNRKNQSMTKEEFASRLGVTPQTVDKWEKNTDLPDITMVADICMLLKIHSDTLLGIDFSDYNENKDATTEPEVRKSMFAEPLKLEFGHGLVFCMQSGVKTDYIARKRKLLAEQTGIVLPVIPMQDVRDLQNYEIRILAYDHILCQKQYLEIHDQTFSDIIDEVVRQCETNYYRILNKQMVKYMCDNLNEQYPGILDGLVPDYYSYYDVMLYLRKRLMDGGDLRDMIHFFEELERSLRKQQLGKN